MAHLDASEIDASWARCQRARTNCYRGYGNADYRVRRIAGNCNTSGRASCRLRRERDRESLFLSRRQLHGESKAAHFEAAAADGRLLNRDRRSARVSQRHRLSLAAADLYSAQRESCRGDRKLSVGRPNTGYGNSECSRDGA